MCHGYVFSDSRDPNWYTDTGASTCMIADIGNLVRMTIATLVMDLIVSKSGRNDAHVMPLQFQMYMQTSSVVYSKT